MITPINRIESEGDSFTFYRDWKPKSYYVSLRWQYKICELVMLALQNGKAVITELTPGGWVVDFI